MNKSTKFITWLLILGASAISGCANLPSESGKGIWPWEYGAGQGEPNTGDYAAFRAGVASFGEPPKAVKPIKPESLKMDSADVPPVPENVTTKAEPAVVSQEKSGKTKSNKKQGYDFTVRDSSTLIPAKILTGRGTFDHEITATNHGDAPVSVAISIENGSHDVSADKALPYYAIVPAHSDLVLVRLSTKSKEAGSRLKYNYVWSVGDYTANHNCRESYNFPFGENVRAFATVANRANETPYTRNAVVFTLPKGTPVLTARNGVVIQIGSDRKLDILHEDSTIASYHHLEKIGDYVVVGKRVTTQDVIGIAGVSENDKEAHMQLTVWRPEPENAGQLLPGSQHIGFEAVSYPIKFMSAEFNNGKVLTKNGVVSRSKLQTASRQKKRK